MDNNKQKLTPEEIKKYMDFLVEREWNKYQEKAFQDWLSKLNKDE